MAVVGDAFVRVRVISSGLSNDIADAVRDGFKRAGPDIDREGTNAGTRAGRAAGESLRTEATSGARRAGSEAADDLETNLRTRLTRNIKQKLVPAFRNSMRDAFKRGISTLTPEKDFDFKAFSRAGQDLSKSLHEGFSLGIGRARMGKAVLSALLLAAPSMLSGAAGIGGALASEIVTAISAIGPGVAGGLALAGAGVATLALNLGLLKLAFASTSEAGKAMKAEFSTFKVALTETFAPGVISGFRDMIANLTTNLLPAINGLLAETGVAMGNVARGFGETVTSAQNLSRIQGILQTNKTFLDNFGVGLNGLTTSFLILFNASKPFVDFLGQGLATFGNWASVSLAAAEANGTLADFMQRLLDKFKQLAGIVADFGVGIYNVFHAASGAGEGLLTRIEAIGEKFRAWTGDSANQERMAAFFAKMDILAHAVFETISSLFGAAGKGLENMNLQPILDFLTTIQTTVGPAVAAVFKEIKEGAGPNLAKAFENLGTALQKVADSGMVQLIAQGISAIVLAASEFINTDFGSFLFSIAVPLGLFGGLISTILGPISALVSVISTLATAGLLPLAAIIGAVVGAFVLMWANSENLRNAIGNLGGVIQEHVVAAFEKIKPLIGPLITAVENLAAAFGDKLAGAINFLAPIIGVVIDKLGVIFEYIIKQATTFINLITAVLHGDWSAAWDYALQAVQNVWELLKGLFGDIASGIADWVGGIGEKIGAGWGTVENKVSEVWGNITGYLSGQWNSIIDGAKQWISDVGDNISSGWNTVTSGISGAWNNITTFFSDMWNSITSGVSDFWDGLVNIFQSGWNNLIAFIQGFGQGLAVVWNMIWEIALIPVKILWNMITLVWNNIKDDVFAIWDTIAAGAVSVWGGITDFFSTVWDGVRAVAETVWNGITSFLSTVWGLISSTAVTVWTGITSFFSTVWDIVTSIFTTVWDGITSFLSTVWAGIVAIATTIWTGLVFFFTSMWDTVVQTVQTVWTTITDFLTTVWTGIQTVATTVWTAISDFFTTVWAGIQTVFTTVATAIAAFLQGVWDGITSVVNSVWNAISSFFASIWNTIWSTISTAAQNIASFLQGIWDSITSAASSAWNAIAGLASDIWNRIVNAVEDVVEPLVGWLQGIWDDISSAVSSAWDGLAGTVGAIWDAIGNAIVQPIEDAWNALVGWASAIGSVISGILSSVNSAVTEVNGKIASMLADQANASAAGQAFAASQGLNSTNTTGAAEGAIVPPVPGGWNMIVGEGGQTERIEPLDRQGLSQRDRALISHLVGQLAGAGGGGGGSGQIAVNVNLDGALLGRFVESIVVDQQGQIGRRAARNRRAG